MSGFAALGLLVLLAVGIVVGIILGLVILVKVIDQFL